MTYTMQIIQSVEFWGDSTMHTEKSTIDKAVTGSAWKDLMHASYTRTEYL